jgi:protein phosphatase
MIRIENAHLQVVARSHPGMSGKNNEDAYSVTAYKLAQNNKTPSVLGIICDGIGGHRAGEVASELAINHICDVVAGSTAIDPMSTLQQAVLEASHAIASQSHEDPAKKGMGSTCACAWVIGNRLYTTHVGDSRIYLLHDSHIQRLTRDHTWIQEAIEAGIITPEQARTHPNAHVIRRYLGSAQDPMPDFRMFLNTEDEYRAVANQGCRLPHGSILLLCSDGLSDLLDDDEIKAAIIANPLDQAAQVLIDLACERGGHDNITVILMKMPERKARSIFGGWKAGRNLSIGCLVLFVLAALLILGYLGWKTYLIKLTPTHEVTPVQETIVPTYQPAHIPPSSPLVIK